MCVLFSIRQQLSDLDANLLGELHMYVLFYSILSHYTFFEGGASPLSARLYDFTTLFMLAKFS
jgi:hypothetical protein